MLCVVLFVYDSNQFVDFLFSREYMSDYLTSLVLPSAGKSVSISSNYIALSPVCERTIHDRISNLIL